MAGTWDCGKVHKREVSCIPLATKASTPLHNEQSGELKPSVLQLMDTHIQSAFAGRVQLRRSSATYNCAGMVFGSRRTWIDIDQTELILSEDGYHKLSGRGMLQKGDVVVYLDGQEAPAHVGVVYRIESPVTDRVIYVLSKWADKGEYIHLIDDVPATCGRAAQYWTER